VKNIRTKFHPDPGDPISNDGALSFFEDVAHKKNKMRSDRSVPDLNKKAELSQR